MDFQKTAHKFQIPFYFWKELIKKFRKYIIAAIVLKSEGFAWTYHMDYL